MAKRRINPARLINWTPREAQRFRLYLGWTQTELADELGSTQHTISEWESGKRKIAGIAAASLTRLANAHGFIAQPDIIPMSQVQYRLPSPALPQIADR